MKTLNKRNIIAAISGVLLFSIIMFILFGTQKQKGIEYEDEYIIIPQYSGLVFEGIQRREITDSSVEERFEQVDAAEAELSRDSNSEFVFDDAYIAAMNSEDYSNIKEFKEFLKEVLEQEAASSYINTVSTHAMDKVIETSTVKSYPKGMVEEEYKRIENEEKAIAQAENMSWEDYIYNTYGVTTSQEYEKIAEESAQYLAKKRLIINAILEQQKLNMTEQDKDKMFENYAYAYQMTVEELKGEKEPELMEQILENKEDWIIRQYLTDVSKVRN